MSRSTRKSIADKFSRLSYAVKSLGKTHLINKISDFDSMTVEQIYQLDPSVVSKNIRREIDDPAHRKTLSTQKKQAVKKLLAVKKILRGTNPAGREKILSTWEKTLENEQIMANKVGELINMTKREMSIGNMPLAPVGKIILSSSSSSGRSSRRGGRRLGRRKKTKRKRQ